MSGPYRILVAAPSGVLGEVLEELLTLRGVEAKTATAPPEALPPSSAWDAAVLAPASGGREAAARLLASPGIHSNCPVVLVATPDDAASYGTLSDPRIREVVARGDWDRLARAVLRALGRIEPEPGPAPGKPAADPSMSVIFEKSLDVVLLIDGDKGTILRASASAGRGLGYAPDVLAGRHFSILFPPSSEGMQRELMRNLEVKDAVFVSSEVQRADGRITPMDLTAAVVPWERGRAVLVTLRDVSERVLAQTQIQRQLARLDALRKIDLAITASTDLRVTLDVILDHVTRLLEVDAATILLMNSLSQSLDHAASRGFLTRALRHTHLRPGEGYAGHAAVSRRLVHIPDLRRATGAFIRSRQMETEGFAGYAAIPLVAKGQVRGVLEIFNRRPLNPDQDWMDFLGALADQAAIAIDNAALLSGLQTTNDELTLAYETTLEGWSRALDLRDRETEGHTRRVTSMTVELARLMKLRESEIVHIRRGALLHDIGKMGIPDAILHKAGPLSPEEWEIMKKHPVYAYELLSPIHYLRPALDIPYCHHEKWDGTGYPRGLKGDQIPLAARLFAVVDVWDALRSDRPYRKAWPAGKVLEHIRGLKESHFDPMALEYFAKLDLQ